MAESLRRVVDMSTFSVLQEKLDSWLDDYHLNTCDQNIDRCVEVIELNSRIQSQLFRILHQSAAEGGTYGGSRLLRAVYPPRPAVDAWSEVVAKDRQIIDLKDHYERSIEEIEADLYSTKDQAKQLKLELTEKDIELEAVKRNSTSDKMFAEDELQELRNRVFSMEEEMHILRQRCQLVDSYEREIRRLRDELIIRMSDSTHSLLNGDADGLKDLPAPTSVRSRSPSPRLRSHDEKFRAVDDREDDEDEGIDAQGIVQKFRQQRLVERFGDMFCRDRLHAIDILRQHSDDSEMNRKIVFLVVQEAFAVARLAFINFKMRIRSTLAPVHIGPGTLEQALQHYINRNPDLYNLTDMVSEVMRNVDRRRVLPDGVSSSVIRSFIREACRVSWGLASLPRPLETLPASDYELYDSTKYRRTFDSDVMAPLVLFHVWPCLTQDNRVIAKGEAHTAKARTVANSSRSRSPVRSTSPKSQRDRQRSSSPTRLTNSFSS